MKLKNIELPMDKIKAFCDRWQITELALFGSVLRNNFRRDSDVDVLVSFSPEAHHTLFDLVHMEDELKNIFQRDVDLVSRRGVETSRNYLRRKKFYHLLMSSMQREPQFLLDMLQSVKLAMSYAVERLEEDLFTDTQFQDSVIRRLLIIGEAARRVSEQTRQTIPEIPWTDINGMRNRLVHKYDDIDLDIVWHTVQNSLPILISELEKILPSEEQV